MWVWLRAEGVGGLHSVLVRVGSLRGSGVVRHGIMILSKGLMRLTEVGDAVWGTACRRRFWMGRWGFNGIGLSNQWHGDPLWGRDHWLWWDGSVRRVMAVGEINATGLKLWLCGWYLWEKEMRQYPDMSDQVGRYSVQNNYPIATEKRSLLF